MKSTPLCVIAFLTLAHAGCSDPEPPPGGSGGGATTSAAATSASASTGAGAGSCEGEVVPGSGLEVDVESIEATVLDLDGAPVAGVLAQACGLDLCKNGKTDAAGHVLIQVGQPVRQPAFKVGDGIDFARIATPVTAPVTVFGAVFTARFPPLSEGAMLEPGRDISSAGVTLSIPRDGVIDLDIFLYDEPAKHVFRAAAIPKDKMDPALVDEGPALQMFFAFTPIDTKLCPAAAVTAPNDAGFPAGADVEIFVHGLDVGEEFAPYGGWTRVSDGRVSEDGLTLSSSEGGGLPLLTMMGVRLK